MVEQKPLVLVVEDDFDQAEMIAKVVYKSSKYDPVIAHNGLEALEELKKNRRFLGFGESKIKCILLDIEMPEMDGLEFIETLRREERKNMFAHFIPIVMLSAYEDSEKWDKVADPIRGMAAGYLRKPFNKDELVDLLDRIILDHEAELMVDATRERSYKRRVQLNLETMANVQEELEREMEQS